MEWDEIRKKRAEAIESMNKSLENVERVNLPLWLISTLMVPVFLGLIICEAFMLSWMMVKFWVWLVIRMAMVPFMIIWLACDVVVLSWWFLKLVCLKMAGK